jgi:hypothetical protein
MPQTTWYGVSELLFGIEVPPNFVKGFKIPQNPKNFAPKGDSPAKLKILNNFSKDRDRQNMSTDHLYKSD